MTRPPEMTETNLALVVPVVRGLNERCPRCGKGRLFQRYLSVFDRCPECALELARFPADDGPAYLTIFLIGHLVVAPILIFPIVWRTSPYVTLPIILPLLTLITLFALARIKGGWIGLLYALDVRNRAAASPAANAVD